MNEIVVINESPENEAKTINRMRCFGWQLVNNQEVAVSHTHVTGSNGNISSTSNTVRHIKLTFERSTDMANFQVLDSYYQRFTALFDKKFNLEKIIHSGSGSSWGISAIVSLIIGLILNAVICLAAFGELGWFWVMLAPVWGISFLICSVIFLKKEKNKLAPQIAEMESEMNKIAQEASRFIE